VLDWIRLGRWAVHENLDGLDGLGLDGPRGGNPPNPSAVRAFFGTPSVGVSERLPTRANSLAATERDVRREIWRGLWASILLLASLVGASPVRAEAREVPDGVPCEDSETPGSQSPGSKSSNCAVLRNPGEAAATSGLSLNEALERAVLRSPELEWFSLERRSREVSIAQAALRPNPALSLEVENLSMDDGTDGLSDSETTLSMQFPIELGAKRDRRAALARAERALVEWDYSSKRLEVMAATARAFVEVLAAQERLELAREFTAIASSESAEVARRIAAGASSRLDANQVEISLATSRLNEHLALRGLERSRAELAASWGSRDPDFLAVRGDFWSLRNPPGWKVLEEEASEIPGVQRWETERQRRQAALSLAESEAMPDIEFQAGFRRLGEENENALVFQVSTPLMLFGRQTTSVEQSRLFLLQERNERAMARRQVRRDLIEAYEGVSASYDEGRTLEEEILPLASLGFDQARNAYRAGRLPYLEVIEAKRRLFEIRERYIEALASHHKGWMELERILGTLSAASVVGSHAGVRAPLAESANVPGATQRDGRSTVEKEVLLWR